MHVTCWQELQTGGLKCKGKMSEVSAAVITSPLCATELWETNLNHLFHVAMYELM
jgi:hypothetical protein